MSNKMYKMSGEEGKIEIEEMESKTGESQFQFIFVKRFLPFEPEPKTEKVYEITQYILRPEWQEWTRDSDMNNLLILYMESMNEHFTKRYYNLDQVELVPKTYDKDLKDSLKKWKDNNEAGIIKGVGYTTLLAQKAETKAWARQMKLSMPFYCKARLVPAKYKNRRYRKISQKSPYECFLFLLTEPTTFWCRTYSYENEYIKFKKEAENFEKKFEEYAMQALRNNDIEDIKKIGCFTISRSNNDYLVSCVTNAHILDNKYDLIKYINTNPGANSTEYYGNHAVVLSILIEKNPSGIITPRGETKITPFLEIENESIFHECCEFVCRQAFAHRFGWQMPTDTNLRKGTYTLLMSLYLNGIINIEDIRELTKGLQKQERQENWRKREANSYAVEIAKRRKEEEKERKQVVEEKRAERRKNWDERKDVALKKANEDLLKKDEELREQKQAIDQKDAEIEQKDAELGEQKQAIEEKQKVIDKLTNMKRQLDNEIKLLKEVMEKLMKKLFSNNKEANEEISKLKKEVEDKVAQLEGYKIRCNKIIQEIKNNHNLDIATMKAEFNKLNQELTNAQNYINSINEINKELRNDNKTLQEQIESIIEDREKIHQELQEAKQRLKHCEGKEAKQHGIQTILDKNTSLRKENLAIRKALEAAEEKIRDCEAKEAEEAKKASSSEDSSSSDSDSDGGESKRKPKKPKKPSADSTLFWMLFGMAIGKEEKQKLLTST